MKSDTSERGVRGDVAGLKLDVVGDPPLLLPPMNFARFEVMSADGRKDMRRCFFCCS